MEWYATFLSIQVSLEMLLGHVVGVTTRVSAVLLNLFCCSPFLPKHDGNLWPKDGIQNKQVNRVLPDKRHGSVSLIPLRGSENEMRNSVAAFSQDSLSVSKQNNHPNPVAWLTQVTSGPLTGGVNNTMEELLLSYSCRLPRVFIILIKHLLLMLKRAKLSSTLLLIPILHLDPPILLYTYPNPLREVLSHMVHKLVFLANGLEKLHCNANVLTHIHTGTQYNTHTHTPLICIF